MRVQSRRFADADPAALRRSCFLSHRDTCGLATAWSSIARTRFTIAGEAASGVPALNGGSGAYSIISCATWASSSPRSVASIVNPKSIPAVTPPPVKRFRSSTTRAFTGTAPTSFSSS